MVRLIVKNYGLPHYICDYRNINLDEEFEQFKSDNTDIFLELILLAWADTLGSQYKNQEGLEFKIDFFAKVVGGFSNNH